MKASRKQSGFTIVETMIVLAVTGALFLLAFAAINGKQNITEFQQAINDIQSQIRQTIAQVGSGDYQDTNNFTCDGTGGTLQIQPGSGSQGTNTGCIFLGRVLQFGVHNTNPQQYVTYPIAGLQNNNGSLSSAAPDAIAPGVTTNTISNYPNASTINTLHYGLTVASMYSVASNGVKTPIGAVGFISTLGSYNGSQLVSGSQQLQLVPVLSSSLNVSSPSMVDTINTNLTSSTVNPGGGVQICFASATTNQSGLVTIGNAGNNLSVSLIIKTGLVC